MPHFFHDVRYAVRTLGKRPGFTVTAALILTLGIGGCTIVFTVIHALILRPLPYSQPDRLVWAWGRFSGGNTAAVSPADFLDYRERTSTFTEFAAWSPSPPIELADTPRRQQLEAVAVSGNFFDVFETRPIIGRALTREDEATSLPEVVVLSESTWRGLYGARADIVGQSLRTEDSRSLTIVGVMPTTFRFPSLPNAPQVWTPIAFANPDVRSRSAHYLRPFGRLRAGARLAQAQQEVDGIAAQLEREYPTTNAGYGLRLVPLARVLDQFVLTPLLVLAGAVTLLLLIACSNVANLLLVRGASRTREVATRIALGTSRGRLIRLLLCETAVVACLGAAGGVLVTVWATKVLQSLPPIGGMLRLSDLRVDVSVLAFAVVTSALAVLVAGGLPALRLTRLDALEMLRTSVVNRRQSGRGSRTLVVGQIALSVVLLVAAGLVLKSFVNVSSVDPGFDPENAVALRVDTRRSASAEARQLYYVDLLDRVRSAPGVASAALGSGLALSGQNEDWYFHAEGRPLPPLDERQTALMQWVSDDYFRALKIPLTRGRTFSRDEVRQRSHVVVIDERLAQLAFPNDDPVGRRIAVYVNPEDPTSYEIVGVAGSVPHALADLPYQTIYFPDVTIGAMTLVARTDAGEDSVASLRAALLRIDPRLPVESLIPLREIVAQSVSGERAGTVSLAAFSAVGLMLAAVGLYGVVAFSTAQRTREIGIRIATGARHGDVLKLVVGDGMKICAVGLGLGVIGAYAAALMLRAVLFGVSPDDVGTFIVAPAVLAAAAFFASYVPARRAARIDPVTALRCE